jgi:chromosome segregation ATPase
MAKLKEDLACSGKEIETLKDEALKAARTLGDLQTQLSSKNQALDAATKTIEDLKSQLATLVTDLESAKERERVLTEKLEKEEALKKDAENKYTQLHDNLFLWTRRLVNAAERITS